MNALGAGIPLSSIVWSTDSELPVRLGESFDHCRTGLSYLALIRPLTQILGYDLAKDPTRNNFGFWHHSRLTEGAV